MFILSGAVVDRELSTISRNAQGYGVLPFNVLVVNAAPEVNGAPNGMTFTSTATVSTSLNSGGKLDTTIMNALLGT